ncbi:MAG: beta-lactamase family protein [Gemmatimonadetes bacterium]|nr:beta-lactamase family protein [Gemmatimonadota bacterium]
MKRSRKTRTRHRSRVTGHVALWALLFPIFLPAQSLAPRLDSIFVRYQGDAPGCVLGIDQGGAALVRRAWGQATIEQHAPNRVETVFEAGSVSKQVTAASIHLLAARGQLALSDDIRRYFPELPDYGTPITITDLLQHTSGLRDWGAIAELEGWPRGTRTINHGHVLAILARQHGLNHPVDAKYSYTNSGYSLLAMLVERISGTPLAEFSAREFFQPLGMTHTSWRDDYARVVMERAQAYAKVGGQWRLDMPFENPHGHGGLLTTVDDLLRWNAALTARRLGSPDVSAAMEVPGVLRDGKAITYGGGLVMDRWRGVTQIAHSGATAGYRAYLARWPEQQLSAVLLCNAGDADATALVRQSVTTLLPLAPLPPATTRQVAAPATSRPVPRGPLTDYVGTWTSADADARWRITVEHDSLILRRTAGDRFALRAVAADSFTVGPVSIAFVRRGRAKPVVARVSIDRALGVGFVRNEK